MTLVVLVTLLLGVRNVLAALATALGDRQPEEGWMLGVTVGVALVVGVPVARRVARLRELR